MGSRIRLTSMVGRSWCVGQSTKELLNRVSKAVKICYFVPGIVHTENTNSSSATSEKNKDFEVRS